MTKTTICKRCDGKGFFSNLAHVEGGKCFTCDGTGGAALKPFDRFFKDCKGSFVGVTYSANRGGKSVVVKQIAKVEGVVGFSVGTKVTPITEEQARAFFAKFRDQTFLAA